MPPADGASEKHFWADLATAWRRKILGNLREA